MALIGGGGGGRWRQKNSKQVGSSNFALQRMFAQEWIPTFKVSPSKMFRCCFFFLFPFLFLWTLTEKMKSLTERARTVCLLDFRLLAVDGSGCFCEAGAGASGKKMFE